MPVKTSEQGDSELFYVKIIRAFPDKRFLEVRSISFTSRPSAYSACDQIQGELDEDCDPARAYVTDKDMMPIRAGLAARESAREFLNPQSKTPQYGRKRA